MQNTQVAKLKRFGLLERSDRIGSGAITGFPGATALCYNLSVMNRQLTSVEKQLIRWMLEHGNPEARDFLSQLERAEVTPYRCSCGCATINLSIDGHTYPSGGLHILADFIFGTDNDLSGVFVFEKQGRLAGLEVYGLAGDAPKALPSCDALRPLRA